MKKMLVLLFCVILMWTMASCGDTESNLKDILQNQIPTQDGRLLNQQIEASDAVFALVDMDQDGIMEAVVQDLERVIVIYTQGEQAYTAEFTFRSMQNILTDGSYSWTYTDAAGHWYGTSRLSLTQDGPEETVLWKVKNDGLPDAKYYWGGEEVSANELQKHRGEYAADKAEFRPLTEENITAIFSGE